MRRRTLLQRGLQPGRRLRSAGVEAREDVLVYTSPPLEKELEVTGPLKVVLYASSSATGHRLHRQAGRRASVRLRSQSERRHPARPLSQLDERAGAADPGELTRFEIDLVATSNAFLPGHRVRVEISSSNFPRFDRNPNTGELPGRSDELVERDADDSSLGGVSVPHRLAGYSGRSVASVAPRQRFRSWRGILSRGERTHTSPARV